MAQKPVVLVINYDENNKSPDKEKIQEIIDKLCEKIPDIFVLTTQDSRSGTKSHIQHSIKEIIKNSKNNKILRQKTNKEKVLENYILFSKIDGTRESNVNNKDFTEILFNCRTRIWINQNTTWKGFTKNFSKQSFSNESKKKSLNNKSKKEYYTHNNITYNQNYNSSNSTKTNGGENNTKIKIVRYLYRRITQSGEWGKKGNSSIMISLCLELNNNTYQYIICNSNPKTTKDILKNSKQTKHALIHMIQDGNVMKENRDVAQNLSKSFMTFSNQKIKKTFFKGTLFILYVSKDNCVFKKIENEPEYKLNEVSAIINTNSGKSIVDNNLKFIQIDKPVEKSSWFSRTKNSLKNNHNSTLSSYPYQETFNEKTPFFSFKSQTPGHKLEVKQKYNFLFLNLKKIIMMIFTNCEKPINILNINKFINENFNTLSSSIIQYYPSLNPSIFNYNFILDKLTEIKDEIYKSSTPQRQKELEEYLSIWKLINEKFLFFKNTKEEQRIIKLQSFINQESKKRINTYKL
jgi:hypothetical protein